VKGLGSASEATARRAAVCARGHVVRSPHLFECRTRDGTALLCLRHALTSAPLARRSLTVALVVGTVVTVINQGPAFLSGHLELSLAWKVPLTYGVCYCVSTAGALLNGRRQVAAEPSDLPSGLVREEAGHD
jgi:hypothetical protein